MMNKVRSNKNVVLTALKQLMAAHGNEYQILRIGLFGSVARGEHYEDSDIDVVVQLNKQDLFVLVAIKQALEDVLDVHVDVVSYRAEMNAFLKRRIDEEAIYA